MEFALLEKEYNELLAAFPAVDYEYFLDIEELYNQAVFLRASRGDRAMTERLDSQRIKTPYRGKNGTFL